MAKVLAVGDTHFPAVHPGYLQFCLDLQDKYQCDTVVHIGDVCDVHAISQHERSPDAEGPVDEYESALVHVQRWYEQFPKVRVCEGNHDARIARMAATVNIPSRFLKGYNELYFTPGWDWKPDHTIDDVHYTHGTGCGGLYPAFNIMQKLLMAVVSGHVHSAAGIWWRANPLRRIFGMNLGCGVDDKHVAFKYGENLKIRSILSAGVVIDGTPYHHVMQCGPKEKYHRSRFTNRSASNAVSIVCGSGDSSGSVRDEPIDCRWVCSGKAPAKASGGRRRPKAAANKARSNSKRVKAGGKKR